jgi:hypothetical protein
VGRNDTAIQMLKAVTPDEPQVTFARDWSLAQAYAVTGRYSEAADTLLAIPENQNRVARRSVEDAARLLRTAPPKVSAPDRLPAFIDELSFIYTYVGAPDRVLEGPERSAALGFLGAVRQLWAPQNALVRKTDRFKALMRKNGLVEYWRAKGWPDLCHPVGADDFACS